MHNTYTHTLSLSLSNTRIAKVWDHAKPVQEDCLASSHLLDTARRGGVCGDFFLRDEASGVEAAALSGHALAHALAPSLRALLAVREQ